MEGRMLRRKAGPTTYLQTHRGRPPQVAAQGSTRTAGARIVAVLLALTLGLAVEAITGVGVAPADAARCKHAHARPQRVSARKAHRAVICLVNKRRRAHGIRPADGRRPLSRSGRRHSRYMKRHRCFAHQCRGEAGLVRRVENTRYLPCNCYWGLGETIARAERRRATPKRIVRAWMHSPAHRAVLLDRRLDDIGVGVTWGTPSNPNAKEGTYTADFGYKRH
jgi:uncharacterized protein YkwD